MTSELEHAEQDGRPLSARERRRRWVLANSRDPDISASVYEACSRSDASPWDLPASVNAILDWLDATPDAAWLAPLRARLKAEGPESDA